jgi:hypothetical protein
MLRSLLFDIADVLRHRVCGAIGNVCRNSRGDLDVIRCALGDQAGLVPRPSVKILEVEAEIVQSVSDSLEHGAAGYLGQLLKRESRMWNPTGSS